jgi:hypothetical protein
MVDEYVWGNMAKLREARTGTWAVRGISGPVGGCLRRVDDRGKK